MPIHNRIATCDICQRSQEEQAYGVGWAGWSNIKGIGASKADGAVKMENLEMHLCTACTNKLAAFLSSMQEDA